MKSIDRLVTGLASELNIDSGARNQARRAWHYLATDTGNLYEILEDNVTLIGTLTLNAPAVYVALLTQTGTNAPVATVLENSLGTVTWTRVGEGDYLCTATGLLTVNKTVILISSTSQDYDTIMVGTSLGVNTFEVYTFFNGDGTFSDGILSSTPVEIRVYP